MKGSVILVEEKDKCERNRSKTDEAKQYDVGNISPAGHDWSAFVDDGNDNADDWSNDHDDVSRVAFELFSFRVIFRPGHDRGQNEGKYKTNDNGDESVDNCHADEPIDRENVAPKCGIGTPTQNVFHSLVNSANPADQAERIMDLVCSGFYEGERGIFHTLTAT